MSGEQAGLLYYIAEQYVAIPNTTEGLRLFRRLSDGLYYVKHSDNTLELFSAGIGSITGSANNSIFQQLADSGNVGAGEDTLYSDDIDADKLSVDGDSISAQYAVNLAANANAKSVSVYFGGQLIYITSSLGISNPAGASIDITVTLIRTGATTAKVITSYSGGDHNVVLAEALQQDVAGLDFTISNNLVITGTGVADNDIIAKFAKGYFEPAAI